MSKRKEKVGKCLNAADAREAEEFLSAVDVGEIDNVKNLLLAPNCKIDIHVISIALHNAIREGHTGIVEFLLDEYGKKIDPQYRIDALYNATQGGRTRIFELLLISCGEDINSDLKKEAVAVAEKSLEVAARRGYTRIAELLVDSFAEELGSHSRQDFLEQAATGGSIDLVKLALNFVPKNWEETVKGNALCNAAREGHIGVVELLLDECGGELDFNSKREALIMAASRGNVAMFVTILEKGGKELLVGRNLELIGKYSLNHTPLKLLRETVTQFDEVGEENLDNRKKALTAFSNTYRSFPGMVQLNRHLTFKSLKNEHSGAFDDRLNEMLRILNEAPQLLALELKTAICTKLNIEPSLLKLYESDTAQGLDNTNEHINNRNNSKRESNFKVIQQAIERVYPDKEAGPHQENGESEDKVKLLLEEVVGSLRDKNIDFSEFNPLNRYKEMKPKIGLPEMPDEVILSILAGTAGISQQDDDNWKRGTKIKDILDQHSKNPSISHVKKLMQTKLNHLLEMDGGGPAAPAV